MAWKAQTVLLRDLPDLWVAALLTLLTCDWMLAPVYGLASAGLTIVILQVTNR